MFWRIEEKLVLAMYLKVSAYCLGVPLLYTVSTVNLCLPGRCEPAASHHDRSVLTTTVPTDPSIPAASRPENTTSERGVGARRPPSARHRRRQAEAETWFTSHKLWDGNCSRGTIRPVVAGKFYIPGQLETSHRHGGYQSDSEATVQAGESQASGGGRHVGGSEESWEKLEPSVECGEDAMTLTVRRKRAIQLLLDQVNGSSLTLVQLPQQCGYSVRSSQKDLTLMAPYDACHVVQEDDGYMLPLLWRGVPAKVSCPRFNPQGEGPSSLCCFPNSMTVKLRGPSAIKNSYINVRGEWTPLGLLAEQCGYTVDRLTAETVVTVPFITCGVTVKDGKTTLLLKLGQKMFMLVCPNPASGELLAIHQPLADSPPDLGGLPNPKLGSLEPLPFMPPFYLAPLFYPHPTYRHRNSENTNPPTPHPLADFGSDHYYQKMSLKNAYELFMTQKPHSAKDQADGSGSQLRDQKQNPSAPLLDLSKNTITPTGLPAQDEAPHFQHPNHAFSSYYHYYHHPKIPLPGTPRGPGPGVPGLRASSDSPDLQSPSVLPNVQLSEGLGETASQISSPVNTQTQTKVTAVHLPHLPHLFPYHLYSYPYIVRGKVKRLGLSHRDWPAKANLSSAHPPLPTVLPNREKHTVNLNKNEPDKAKTEGVKRPTPGPRAVQSPDPVAAPPDKPVLPTPGFTYNANPSKYYYHPHYNYYLKYYLPEALRGIYGSLAQTSSQSTAQQPSNFRYPTSSPTSEPESSLMFPYYYYYHYYLPQMLRYYQQLHHPGGTVLSSNSDHSELQKFPRAAEGRQPSLPLSPSNAFNQAYSTYIAWLDDYMKAPAASSSEHRKLPCLIHKLSSDPDSHTAPLERCAINGQTAGQQTVDQSEVQGFPSDGAHLPVRLMVGCSPPLHPAPLPSTQPPPSAVAVVLRIATDASFTKFYPEAHLPISLLQSKPVHVELRLLEPAEPSLLLVVHSCLAYTLTPHVSWMLFYDRCSSQSASQQLPSPDPQRICRLTVPSFPPLLPASATHMTHGGPSAPEDPEVYLLCHTELCSTVYGECGVSCTKGSNMVKR